MKQKAFSKMVWFFAIILCAGFIACGSDDDDAQDEKDGSQVEKKEDGGQTGYLQCPDDKHPHMIDLGEGTLWACCNVGASSPEQFGNYYAWGEIETKDEYSLNT